MNLKTLIITFTIFSFFSCKQSSNELKLNDIQVLGSHNSYKIAIEEPLWDYIYSQDSVIALSLQYDHIPIIEQLNLGLRNLELDIFHDPLGGHFLKPAGIKLLEQMNIKSLPYDLENKLNKPGFKVFHVQDIDFRSHHLLFADCLKAIKKWSKQNPNHTPIFITINAKDEKIEGTRFPLPFTKSALDSIDLEIKSIFSDKLLITPDVVRKNHKTLEDAILTNGWPSLKEMKGKFLFVLDEFNGKVNNYIIDHASLKNRVLFVDIKEGNPEAAFRIINDPIKNFDYIKELVNKGYMVRTRADSDTEEARKNNYFRFKKAKESGAQIITTDYYKTTDFFNSTYKVSFDNKYERFK